MSKEKTKKSPLKVLLIILLSLVAFVAIVLLGARMYFRIPVSAYYRASEKTFVIPGLKDGFIAQGLSDDSEYYYVTGYMKGGSASPIYMVDKSTGKCTKTVYLANESGEAYHGHCGGLTVHAPYIYVAGGSGLYVYDLAAVQSTSDKSSVSALGYFPTRNEAGEGVGVAFTAVNGSQLIIGEFYRAANYPTADSHKLNTPGGDYNQALAYAYDFSDDEDSMFGLCTVPSVAYSLPDQVQGMAIRNNRMYLSISYGAAKSHILVYDMSKMAEKDLALSGYAITAPTYFCDSISLTSDIQIAPMSEEIIFDNNKLYVMCESASTKYIFGNFTSAKWCYATDMTKLEAK